MEKASYENLGSECSAFGRRSRAGAGCGQLSWGTFHRSSGGDDEPQAVKEGEGGWAASQSPLPVPKLLCSETGLWSVCVHMHMRVRFRSCSFLTPSETLRFYKQGLLLDPLP